MKKSAIQERRQNVSNHLIKGKAETEIANELGVHRNTIVRDVSFLKKQSQNWLDGLAKNGFIFEYKLALAKIRDHESELQKLYNKTNDLGHKIQILKALDDNAKLYLELLGETPTIHAYKRAIKQAQDQNLVQTT